LTLPTSNDKRSNQEEPRYWENAGFKGGTFLGGDFDETRGLDRSSLDSNEGYSYQCWKYDYGHIAMTYTALCTLITLGDDLRGIDKQCIMRALKGLQLKNGR
jgi:geranylgeranyl transferase type-1 subunit beta